MMPPARAALLLVWLASACASVPGTDRPVPLDAGYAARERDALARTGRYRCSSGLVLDALGDRRGATTLGEADAATRAELREQIAHEQLADVLVVDDAVAALACRQWNDYPTRFSDLHFTALKTILNQEEPDYAL